MDNGGNASAALGRNLTSGEQGQIVGVFGTGDTIRFTSSASPRTITLTSGELLLSRGATIAGPGPSLLTVSGNYASRVFEIAAGISVKLDGLTIANGTTGNGYGDAGKGGGILNSGTLIVSNCILTGNSAYSGGGIFSTSILDMGGCILTANASMISGGGIQCSGTADLLSSMLSGNSADFDGGGIYSSGDLTVSNCTLTNNSARNNGGGIVNMRLRSRSTTAAWIITPRTTREAASMYRAAAFSAVSLAPLSAAASEQQQRLCRRCDLQYGRDPDPHWQHAQR